MYTLDNAIELNNEFPETFYIPPYDKISAIKIGDFVKLIFREDQSVERMWVKVTETPELKDNLLCFTGVLDNDPYKLKTIKCGDPVSFSQEHIIQLEVDV